MQLETREELVHRLVRQTSKAFVERELPAIVHEWAEGLLGHARELRTARQRQLALKLLTEVMTEELIPLVVSTAKRGVEDRLAELDDAEEVRKSAVDRALESMGYGRHSW